MDTSLFTASTSEILLNPRLDKCLQAKISHHVEALHLKKHIVIASSGTTKSANDAFKLVALSKKAILTSAHAVNQHLEASSKDVWLNPLPCFHVGGLGIFARASLSASAVVILEKWSPLEFVRSISENQVTFTSLVPSQVYDLVTHRLNAPKSIRAVIVGGGALSQQIYENALALGWKLIVSYGLSECASQVATSKVNEPALHLLSHVEAKIDSQGYLNIKSDALLSSYIFVTDEKIEVIDPKVDGWLKTEDLCVFEEDRLKVLGRASDFLKIGGESVLFSNLEKRFEEVKFKCQLKTDTAIVAFPDDRLGFVVHLVSVSNEVGSIVEKFNDLVMPYERIRHTHLVDHIPRTPLKKLCKQELLQLLS